jgi:hypothetical protein
MSTSRQPMQIVRSVVIDCHIEDVFDYVADPLHDRELRTAALTCVERQPPHHVAWRGEADAGVVDVSFALEPVWTSTRLTVTQEGRLQGPRILGRALKWAAARDLDRRLEALRRRLERR